MRTAAENQAARQDIELTTFQVGDDLYGIEVTRVQEVTGHLKVIAIPQAPSFVLGLVNLRGQIATALGMRAIFGRSRADDLEIMSVVCRVDGSLVSLIVDSIGEVVKVDAGRFEPPPATMSTETRRFLKGICKLDGALLCVVDFEKLCKELIRSVAGGIGAENNHDIRRAI